MTARSQVHGSSGFTLVEMLVAMGILAFGFSALIGLMNLGVSTRRTAELRNQAVYAVDQVLQTVRDQVLATRQRSENGALISLEPLELATIVGYPRLQARVTFQEDAARPGLVRVTVRIAWLEEGIEVGEEFERVMNTWKSLSRRVAEARSKQ